MLAPPPVPAVTTTTPSGDVASRVTGALFLGPVTTATKFHTCSGVVVHSTRRDLAATAAHCLAGTAGGARFAPGLIHNTAPYGRWKVRAAWVDARWRTHRDAKYDLALLSVTPKTRDGKVVRLEDVVPGAVLGHAPATGTALQVLGYALGSTGDVLECAATSTLTGTSPTVGCPGFVDGTSGGPWLAGAPESADVGADADASPGSPSSGLAIKGLTSGLHQGGCTPDVSYAAALGKWSDALLQRVERRPHGDLLPFPPGDGC